MEPEYIMEPELIVSQSSQSKYDGLTPAERMYNGLKARVSKYQKEHPDKCRAKNARYLEKIKAERPEVYEARLAQKRLYYFNTLKPKIEDKKKQLQELQNTLGENI